MDRNYGFENGLVELTMRPDFVFNDHIIDVGIGHLFNGG